MTAIILDRETGEQRTCVIKIFFERSKDPDYDWDDEIDECGHSHYAVLSATKNTGERFYFESRDRVPWKESE